MGRVLRGLVGPENFVGATLKQFSGQFGMQSWIGKKIAVFTDASLDGISKREHGIIAENLNASLARTRFLSLKSTTAIGKGYFTLA